MCWRAVAGFHAKGWDSLVQRTQKVFYEVKLLFFSCSLLYTDLLVKYIEDAGGKPHVTFL